MANYGPSSAFILVGGSNISGDTFAFSDKAEQILEEVHALGDSWEEHLPVGIGRNLVETTGGLYDDRTVGMIEALQGKAATVAEAAQLMDYGVAGSGLGQEAVMLQGTYVGTWTRTSARDALLKGNGTHTITGTRHEGKIVGALTLRTGDGNTQAAALDNNLAATPVTVAITSSSAATERVLCAAPHLLATGDWVVIAGHAGATPALNHGTSSGLVTVFNATEFSLDAVADITVGGTGGTVKKVSSAGLIADLQLTTLTLGGASDVIVKVRHSEDNVTYADLITFTAVTLASSFQRIETTTDPRRYLAISWTGTGAAVGTVTPFVAVART